MSSTTEKCYDIVRRLTKAIETIETYKSKSRTIDENPSRTLGYARDNKKEEKQTTNNEDSSAHLSPSPYTLLFQTLIEIRTKSYTKYQGTRARLIHYNIIKKIFFLLCEKPNSLQTAYENYLAKSTGRRMKEDQLREVRKSSVGKNQSVEEIRSKVEPFCSDPTKDKDCGKCNFQPLEVDEHQMNPFMDFRDLLLSLLGNFCLDSAAQNEVVKHHGIPVLRSILFESESESIWRRCCRTLANLAVDPACRKAIEATDITAKIICILESSCDSECQATICRTLRLFADSSDLLKTIIECNGISILIQICKYGTQSVKGAAVKTLAELGKKNCSVEFGQQVLRGEGLVKLVEMTKEDAAHSENALSVLVYLSHHSFMRPIMGSSDVIQTLQSKFESKTWLGHHAEILNAFCLFSNEAINRVKLRQSGILKVLLSALQDQHYATLHNCIISSFVNFLYDDSSFDLLLESGLVPVLFVHLQRCAGFSFTMPSTEPFVESLIEAVMNRGKDPAESVQEHECSESKKNYSNHNMAVDKDSDIELVDKGHNSGEASIILNRSNINISQNNKIDEKTSAYLVIQNQHYSTTNNSFGKEEEVSLLAPKDTLLQTCGDDSGNHSKYGGSNNYKKSNPEEDSAKVLVPKGYNTNESGTILNSNPDVNIGQNDQKDEKNPTPSLTPSQHLSMSDTFYDKDKDSPSLSEKKIGAETTKGESFDRLSDTPNRKISRKRITETEVFTKPSKRYRLSIGIETNSLKEPAILNLRVPRTHNLSQLGAETVANIIDMSASTVLSHASRHPSPESSEKCTAEIVAFHHSSLSEPSHSESAGAESGDVDICVSLRTKCSPNRIEQILKSKGFSVGNESEVSDDTDREDGDEVLEKDQRGFYSIDSPSYRDKVEWQVDNSSNDTALKLSSTSKELTGTSGQCFSPLSPISYNSPDWNPQFSLEEDDFSSENSYSSADEIQVDANGKPAFGHCDEKHACPHKKKNASFSNKRPKDNRTTEDNILMLLSRISQKENPAKYLANMESFLCLLHYIGHVPCAFPRGVRILGRVVSNIFCLESLLGFMAPALIFLELMTSWNHRICDAQYHSEMFWTPPRATWLNVGSAFTISSCIKSSTELLKAGQLLLNEFGVVAEINFGTCLLSQHLMKETPQKNYVIACLPFLCRSHNVQEKLLVKLKGFELLQNIVLSNPKKCLSKVIILGLSYLACHLNLKSDPITSIPYPRCSQSTKSSKCCLKDFQKDITFVTDYGQRMFANREQLTCQSDVFSAMLTSNFLESTSTEVAIPEISLVALRFIVHYLHGCSAKCKVIEYIVSPKSNLPFDDVVNVLAYADQYMLTQLQNYLVKIVREKYLNYRTAGEFYNVASLHNYDGLRKACVAYCLVSLVFGSKSVSCMMDILTGPYAAEFLELVKKMLKKHAIVDYFAKV